MTANLKSWLEYGYVTCEICGERIDCFGIIDGSLFVMIEEESDMLVYHIQCFVDDGIRHHVSMN